MLAYLIVDLLIVFGFLFVGLIVMLKNSKAILNQLFLGFVITISVWVIANYFSNNFDISYQAAVIANHLTLFSPGIVLLFLLHFILRIAGGRTDSKRWRTVTYVYLVIYALTLTPLMFTSIHRQDNVYAINFTGLGSVYFVALIVNMILIVTTLIREKRRSTGEVRGRLNAILWGVSALLGINVATNALLPALGGTFALTNIGPLSGVFVIYALWYSIIKQRLFDIRMIITRSLGYALSLASLAAIFIAGTFALTSLVFGSTDVDNSTLRWVYALLAAVSAFLFAPLKAFFDRVSSRIFFRDSYDTQVFLDEFNKNLVLTYELNDLLKKSALIITENLKPVHSLFAVSQTHNTQGRVITADSRVSFTNKDTETLTELISRSRQKLFITDELENRNPALKHFLRSHDIALVARMTSAPTVADSGVGYLILGPKKSGNLYSPQDVKVVEIIANELVIAIQNALRFEEIENFNVTLQQKVDEATRKLRRANEKLKALDETKDDFISMASHQLRTPLTSVKGYLSMVLEGDVGKITPKQREMVNQAFSSSQRMVYLIADLLNVSRLKTGKFVIEPKSVNLADLVEQELSQLGETAKTHSIDLNFEKPKHFPNLMLDETKIRQVIMNFVDNAIYYTPVGGKITVSLAETPSSVSLRVQDTGIGVPKQEQPHLFTKFYRAGNARKARPDGTGLGLFMAKKVIIAQGGSLIFESQQDKGSTFGFTFSRHRLEAAAASLTDTERSTAKKV